MTSVSLVTDIINLSFVYLALVKPHVYWLVKLNMPKSCRKRDHSPIEDERLLKKLKKLKRKIKKRQHRRRSSASSSSDEINHNESTNHIITEEQRPLSPEIRFLNDPEDIIQELPEVDNEMDEKILKILGDNPEDTKNEIILDKNIICRWSNWIKKGINKEDREVLLKKYPRRGDYDLEAPTMNQEVVASFNEITLKRDKHFLLKQHLIGSALVAIGSAISDLLQDNIIDKLKFLECLSDAGKLLTDSFHSLTEARKAFIIPSLSKQAKLLLENTDPDYYLFGEKLGEKLKDAKNAEKLGLEMKSTEIKKSGLKFARHLNYKSPSVKQYNRNGKN